MKNKTLFLSIALCAAVQTGVRAQGKWSLLRCVEYARENNIAVKLSVIPTGYAELQVKQDRLSGYPNASLSNNYGMSFGRRENPTTGVFEDQRFFNIGIGLQTSVAVFNWFSRRNTIQSNLLELQANRVNTDKLKNDLSLTVATQYLSILLSMEQEKIAAVQLQQTKAQLENTRKQVKAGVLPELNAAELEAKVASDSATVVAARGNVLQGLLTIKSSLNLDPGAPFEIETPDVTKIPIEDLVSLQPEMVYSQAVQHLPQQQFNAIKRQSAEKLQKAAWGAMRPSISAFGGLNSNFIYFRTPFYESVPGGLVPTGLVVNNGGTQLDVLQQTFKQTDKIAGYFTPKSLLRQFKENFGQNIGIGISVPIFNGGSLRNAYERSKLAVKNWDLVKEQDNQKLKQDIYQAHNAAVVALEKFNASKKSVETAERSYNLAQKRYGVGMLSTFDLITNQNNLFRERLQLLSNQFDYVFKMKVLEFYKGQGLKL